MKKLFLLLLILSMACKNPSVEKVSNPETLTLLDSLIETQNYFKLKESFYAQKDNLSKDHKLYYQAIVYNVFNKLSESNAVIDELLSPSKTKLSDTVLNTLYNTKLLNHVNLYEYGEAAMASKYIQENFLQLNDSSDIENLKNEINIWSFLKNIPKQEIVKSADVSFPMVKDKVGLFNVDVSMNDKTMNFIFDTGANISVIKKSLVEELGLTFIESNFYVTAFTGQRVDSDLAIANELMIGDLMFKNVVFLVLNDADVSFPQIDYYINGIIGFPVIEAMDEIRISKNDTISIPKIPIDYNKNNFALDGLTPIIAVTYQKDTLSFGFDTGARQTALYEPFYEKYKTEIEEKYTPTTFQSASAGGTIEFEGFVLDSVTLSVGESSATLKDLRLHINNIGTDVNHFHGNFGQDFIKQFDEMIISFKYSSVLFK
ncbi:retropepsin-like aspartic protease [Flavobacteriaceae bacterium SZ-1-7]|uniref:retropepsin-like aspartic protease n=1 Tax=Tamlana sedimenti TaxID=3134126 RepID=UPI003124B235